jgi:hypothetical protein
VYSINSLNTTLKLEDFNSKVGGEDIFKPTTGNGSLHEISNDNGDIVVNYATSKNLTVTSTMFPHCNIHKLILKSHDRKESAVCIATGYGLDDRDVGVRIRVGSRILASPYRPDRLWGPHNLLYN